MADEVVDPREVPWHPRHRTALRGQDAAESRLLHGWRSGRLHHAWLLSGPKGIGKATLAYRFARFLLQHPEQGGADLLAPDSLAVDPQSQGAKLVAARSHPDLLVVERAIDPKSKKVKSEIAVDDARAASTFFARTAAYGGWRVAIVDSADDLNGESANALLKIIEEPPARAIFLLVSHRPGALLRTIRSRCIDLPMPPLASDDTVAVLQDLAPSRELPVDELRRAAELAGGSPGRALALAGSKGAAAFAGLRDNPRLTPGRCVEIAIGFAGRDQAAAADYDIFCSLLVDWIGREARRQALAGGGGALAAAHDDIVASLRQTDALNLDRRQTVLDALLALDEAQKASSDS